MAGIYMGVGGVRREMTECPVGIGGVTREVTEIYAGVGGVRRLVWQKPQAGPDMPESGVGVAPAGFGYFLGEDTVFVLVEAINTSPDRLKYYLSWDSAYETSLYAAQYAWVWHPGEEVFLLVQGEAEENYDYMVCDIWMVE